MSERGRIANLSMLVQLNHIYYSCDQMNASNAADIVKLSLTVMMSIELIPDRLWLLW